MDFIFESCINYIHTYTLSSQIFMHSPSILLMLETVIISIISLPLHSFSGVPTIFLNHKSWICSLKPLLTSPIFSNLSSILASTTMGTLGISLYNFWTVAWVLYAIPSTTSFSLWKFFTLSLTSYFSSSPSLLGLQRPSFSGL
jgi:hypothetical protein